MNEHRPPCPRCSFPYKPGAAERYWEARWRDEKSENERLRALATPSLRRVNMSGTDLLPMDEVRAISSALSDTSQLGTSK